MRRLPLFPLPVVLFPGAAMPLHIFEPRYRQMMAHCIEGDRRFGLLYHDPDRHGPFRFEGQVGCVAEILEFQPIPDGRSVVLARGIERFRIEAEVESQALYYEGLVQEYPDVAPDVPERRTRRRRSFELFRRALERLSDAPATPPLEEDRDGSFQLAQWIQIDPAWQQDLLERRDEPARLAMLDELLRKVLEAPE
jgi:Lon protease-like protein